MKIEFISHRDLLELARTVKPGDTLESPTDAQEELLQAFVNNGIAKILPDMSASDTAEESESSPDPQNSAGGE